MERISEMYQVHDMLPRNAILRVVISVPVPISAMIGDSEGLLVGDEYARYPTFLYFTKQLRWPNTNRVTVMAVSYRVPSQMFRLSVCLS